MEAKEVGRRWSDYIGELFDGERPEMDDAAVAR